MKIFGRYDKEAILDSEDLWKHNFNIQFVRENADGTEWWQVIHLESKRVVNCNSMVHAFRICILAQEKLEHGRIQSYSDKHSLEKACFLLYGYKACKYSTYKMHGYRYFNNRWHNPK